MRWLLAFVILSPLAAAAETPSQRLAVLGQRIVQIEAEVGEAVEARDQALLAADAARAEGARASLAAQRAAAQLWAVARLPLPALIAHADAPQAAVRAAAVISHWQGIAMDQGRAASAALMKAEAAEKTALAQRAALEKRLVHLRQQEDEVRAELARRKQLEAAAIARDAEAAARRRAVDEAAQKNRQVAERAADLAALSRALPPAPVPVMAEPDLPAVQATPTREGQRLLAPVAGNRRVQQGEKPRLIYESVSGARVVAPVGGRIRFAGQFQHHGMLVIIEPESDTLMLLTGLSEVEREMGEQVRPGEPLGRAIGGANTPVILEIRHNGTVVDPLRWARQ